MPRKKKEKVAEVVAAPIEAPKTLTVNEVVEVMFPAPPEERSAEPKKRGRPRKTKQTPVNIAGSKIPPTELTPDAETANTGEPSVALSASPEGVATPANNASGVAVTGEVVKVKRKRRKRGPKGFFHGGARDHAGHPVGVGRGVTTLKKCFILPTDVNERLVAKSKELQITDGRVAARLIEAALDANLPLAPKRRGEPDPEWVPVQNPKPSEERLEIEILPNGIAYIRAEMTAERAKEFINASKYLRLTPGQYVAQLAVEAFSQL